MQNHQPSDVSEKAETLDAYRAEVKAQIKERKENEGKAKKEDQAVEQAVANAEIDLPEPMVDLQAKQMADDFARRIMQQGLILSLLIEREKAHLIYRRTLSRNPIND